MIEQAQIDFSVELPPAWQLVSHQAADKLWAYESSDARHRLTVSILYFPTEPSHAQQGQFLKELLQSRQQAATNEQVEQVTSTFSEIDIEEYDTAWIGHLAETSSDQRLATTKAIASKVGIATFYVESATNIEAHNDICRQILATTGFVS